MPGKLVRAEAGHAVVEVHGEQLTVAVDARGAVAGAPVSVGIRPEHLHHGDAGEGSPLHTQVTQMERLGDESLLYLSIAPDAPLVTLRIEGHAPQTSGDSIALRIPPQQCHQFDAAGRTYPRSVQLPT